MRNLSVLYHSIRGLKEAEGGTPELQEALKKKIICCNDSDSDTLFILEGNQLFVLSCKDEIEISVEKNINVGAESSPVGAEYWSDNGILYCAYSTGELIKITPSWPFDQEVVAHIDEGIKCIKLSPDQEVLVLVTGSDNVMTMMSNLQVLSKVDLNDEDFGEKQFVTAGWGTKETQFHGTEGKAAAKAKPIIIGKTENDSGSISVSWRGDGTRYAVSYMHQKKEARYFKVFNRQGTLQCTSELTNGLEENLSWKPSGNLIACSQRLPNKHVIALFEKNGLKHRDFTLPFSPNEINVKLMSWSPDSDILAIWGQKIGEKKTFIQMWIENNYHWYLKQTINFEETNPLAFFAWSTLPRSKKRLFLLTNENFIIYTFRWSINCTRGYTNDDKSIVGVVDGDKILLTALKVGIVPPPMSHQSLQINRPSNGCFFAPPRRNDTLNWLDSNCLFVHLCDDNNNNQLALYTHQKDGLLEYKFIRTFDLEWEIPKIIDDTLGYTMHHFVWMSDTVILCSISVEGRSNLCIIHINNLDIEKGTGQLVVSDSLMMDGYIHHIAPTADANLAYLIVNNNVLKYTHGEGITPAEIILPEFCDHVEVVRIGMRDILVTLGSRNRLFFDGAEVANNITSICTHSDFLLLTTLQHALVTVRMDELGLSKFSMSTLSIKSWGTDIDESTGLSIRRMERGGSLVAALPRDSRAILQMPRGNLETVQPRSMSLHIIKTHLNCLNYFAVFDIMRKQRINLNLIHDHNPRLFMANTEKFIDDIKNPCWLNYFISELVEEDVTDTIYKSCYTKDENSVRRDEFEKPDGRKVERICQHLRTIMEKKASERNLVQPILTCLVKNKHVAGLEAALQKVKEFKSKESRQQSPDEALKYLLYLVDVNILYDIALGMYDLELAKFVASKSQKDPKEYIPYLNKLGEMEEHYRKYKINKDLKRYGAALEHIAHRLDKFDECIDLIINHDLYVQAVKTFPRDSQEYKKVATIAGEYLSRNKKYREAGLMYHRGGNLERAFDNYKIAGSWQDAIIVSTEMDVNPGELNKLYRDLVRQMNEDRRYRDAADISLNYMKREEDAVSFMCKAKEWREAARVAYTYKRSDLIETEVKPGVQEHAAWLLLKISENKDDFLKHKKRLLIVRCEIAKRQAEEALFENEHAPEREISDLLSETSSLAGSTTSLSSGSSRSSGRSYRSSKNRRKQEKKTLSIKEGSVYEDLALIRALYTIIVNTYEMREEVVSINRILLHLYLDDIAEKLQNALIDLIEIIEKNKYDIWPKEEDQEEENRMNGHRRMVNPKKLLEPKYNYPPEVSSTNWKLDIFSRTK